MVDDRFVGLGLGVWLGLTTAPPLTQPTRSPNNMYSLTNRVYISTKTEDIFISRSSSSHETSSNYRLILYMST